MSFFVGCKVGIASVYDVQCQISNLAYLYRSISTRLLESCGIWFTESSGEDIRKGGIDNACFSTHYEQSVCNCTHILVKRLMSQGVGTRSQLPVCATAMKLLYNSSRSQCYIHNPVLILFSCNNPYATSLADRVSFVYRREPWICLKSVCVSKLIKDEIDSPPCNRQSVRGPSLHR